MVTNNQLVEKNCILLDQELTTFEEVIRLIGTEFEKAGIVKPTYAQAVIEREKVFPTGLAADGCNIAIPHTDPEHVLRPGIGVVVTKEPIEVSMMGSPEIKLQTRIFFPLAMEHPKKQLALLRQLMGFLQNKEDLQTIEQAATADEVLAVLGKIEF
ncbi:PTS sugar transporter subunit IIA [Enterococcus florum]|uniref:PTS sugar transporter subunit IIA n=1 Tax=Enterococcus florum TaxID=2480627 RepID=A0A4V0WPA5_9ENTE|nr:PTS sugar transporter subunit IIA [Enterococcus florum]GCF93179.1 PTS sugar transporter subunit IIA [Enterococcus florum]